MQNKRRPRDPQATRAAILDAARRQFIRLGFRGASLAKIARDANTHKSLILHHFESKEGLWTAVKSGMFEQFVSAQTERHSRGPVSREELEQTARDYFHYLQQNPDMVKLLTWAEMEQDQDHNRFEPPHLDPFLLRLQEAQRAGLIASDINPAHLLLLLINASTQWFEARPMFRNWPALQADESLDEAFLDSMIRIIFDGTTATTARQKPETEE